MKLSTAKKMWIKLSVLVVLLGGAAVEMRTAQAAAPFPPRPPASSAARIIYTCSKGGPISSACIAQVGACMAKCPQP